MATPISNTPYARALYDYNAAGNINKNGHSDVSFRKGEFVEILTQKPFGGWMLAKLDSNGKIGYFPMNYFQMNAYKDKSFTVTVIVLHDYVSSGYLMSNGDKDLSVRKGEVISQIDPNIMNGWIRVKSNNSEVGVIPASYVAKLSSISTTPVVPQHRTDKNNNSNNSSPLSQDSALEQTITRSSSVDTISELPPPTSNDSAPSSQDASIATLRMCAYSAPAMLDVTLLNEQPPITPPKTPSSTPNEHELPHQSPYHSNTLPPSRPPLAKAASQMHISELTREMSLLLQERRRKSETETNNSPASPEISPRQPYPRVATPIPSRRPAPPTTPKPAYLIEEILSEVRPRRHSSVSSDEGSGNMNLPGVVSDDPQQRLSPRSPRSPRPVPTSVPSSCVKCGKAGHWADSCPEGEEEKQEEGITFTYHKGKTMIKAATKERLIEGLYSEKIATYDFISEYVDVFLLTYRTFVTPKELFQDISAVYHEACLGTDEDRASKKPKRVRVCNFLKKWMENFSNDFESDPELMQMYEGFVTEHLSSDESLMSILSKTLRRRGFKPERRMSVVLQPPKPLIPKALSFFEIEPMELARQMCLMDFDMFKNIGARELLAKHWVGSALVITSPNLWKMIQRFNQVSNWVAHCVVREEIAKKRAAVIQRFLKVGKECLALNNFNAVFQITSGLHSSAVHRLRKTWELVRKEKEYAIFEELETVTATRNSFTVYRDRLRSANPPCIPFFGVYQSDLTFIADGNADIFDNGYINFFKRRLVAEVIKEIQTFQQTSYLLYEIEIIQTWLKSQDMENLDTRTIYGISLAMEPREGSSDHISEKVKTKAKSIVTKEKKRRDSFSIPSLDGLKSIMKSSSSEKDSGREDSPKGPKPPSKLNKFFGEQNINFDFYVKYSQAPVEEPIMEDGVAPPPVEGADYSKITASLDLTPAQIEQYKKDQIARYQQQHGKEP